MAFAYGSDVGVPSYHEIEAFCRKSNIPFSVSSTTGGSHVSNSYHYRGNAEDLVSSAGNMERLAAWLYQYYPYILELIHSGGSGYFVKNGQKVSASYYGASTVSQHYNHVHIAMTNSGIAAAQGHAVAASGTIDVQTAALANPVATSGCTIPAVTMIGGLLTVGYVIEEVVRGVIS